MVKTNRLGAVLAAAALTFGLCTAQAGAVEVRKTSHAGSGMAMMKMHHGMMMHHRMRHHPMMMHGKMMMRHGMRHHPMMMHGKMMMHHHHHKMMHKAM